MYKLWAMGGLALVLAVGNFGCYLDELQAQQRANRTLQEQLAVAQADLKDAEQLVKQRDIELDAARKNLAAKEEQVASLTAENGKLRDSLANAEQILKEMAGKGVGSTVVIERRALPEPLNKALKDLAAEYPDILEFDEKTGVVRWKSDLLFPLGSDQLAEAGSEVMAALGKFADIVNSDKATGFDVVIVGHTCDTRIAREETRREHKTNWHLSAHRAIAVMNMLAEHQVALDRMGIMGYSQYRPITSNSTPEGKAKNRRVEIYLVPKGSVQSVGQGVYKNDREGLVYVMPSRLGRPLTEAIR